MGQLHNLHPQLFDTTKYQVAKQTAAAAPVDPDDAFFAKMDAAQ